MLLNKKDKFIRTFINTAQRNSDKMLVSRSRKIKLLEPDKEVSPSNMELIGNREFHSAVGSKENDYILLFDKFDLLRLKI